MTFDTGSDVSKKSDLQDISSTARHSGEEVRHCANREVHRQRWLGRCRRHLGLLDILTPVFGTFSLLSACNASIFEAAVFAMLEASNDENSQKMLKRIKSQRRPASAAASLTRCSR